MNAVADANHCNGITPAAIAMCMALASPAGAQDQMAPLTAVAGDAARGRTLAVSRDGAHCILCHGLPGVSADAAGNLAPPLDAVGARLSPAQLRLRVADSTRINPLTIMPAYHRTEGLNQVAAAWRGKPILSAQEVEDVVAYLAGLK